MSSSRWHRLRAVELARRAGHAARQVGVADDRDAAVGRRPRRARSASQLPPCSAARSTIDRARAASSSTMSRVSSLGAGLPGMSAVVTMMSTSFACSRNSAISAAMNSVAHRLGVAALAGRRPREVDGRGTRRPCSRPAPRRPAACRTRARSRRGPCAAPMRGEAGDAGADDQHLGGRHLAGGGDLAGEEATEAARGLDRSRGSRRCWPSTTARRASARGRCAAPRPSRSRWRCARRAARPAPCSARGR